MLVIWVHGFLRLWGGWPGYEGEGSTCCSKTSNPIPSMKFLRTTSLSLLAAGLLLSSRVSAADTAAGYFDIGSFTAPAKGEYVEVNIQPSLLSFVARLAAKEDPEAAELIRGLKCVRVNVVKLDDTNRANTTERIAALREKLNAEGWQKTVTVRESGDKSVDVHVKMGSQDEIEGLVVTVIDSGKEAVVVNVVGSIKPEQLAQLGEHFDIKGLRDLHGKKHVEKS